MHLLEVTQLHQSICSRKHLSYLKPKAQKKVRDIANQSYLEDMPVEVIGNVRFFDLLNSSSNTLQQFRKYKYNGMVAAYH